MNPEPCLTFEVIYIEDYFMSIKVEASNGKYAGVSSFYFDAYSLIEFAEKL